MIKNILGRFKNKKKKFLLCPNKIKFLFKSIRIILKIYSSKYMIYLSFLEFLLNRILLLQITHYYIINIIIISL